VAKICGLFFWNPRKVFVSKNINSGHLPPNIDAPGRNSAERRESVFNPYEIIVIWEGKRFPPSRTPL